MGGKRKEFYQILKNNKTSNCRRKYVYKFKACTTVSEIVSIENKRQKYCRISRCLSWN